MNDIERLAPAVKITNPDGVREYLSRYPELVEVVPLAAGAARRFFPEAQLVLDVYEGPEIEDRYLYLVLYFRLKSYTDFVDRYERAEAEFIHHLRGKRGWIHLTTDFQEPEEDGR